MKSQTENVLDRLSILWNKLELEGRYVDANTVALAQELIQGFCQTAISDPPYPEITEKSLWDLGFSRQTRMHPKATLENYWCAPNGDVDVAELSTQWQDKPTRLLYDLIGEILHLRYELELSSRRLALLEHE